MILPRFAKRLVLPPRQLFGDDGLFGDGVFGGDDDDEETTATTTSRTRIDTVTNTLDITRPTNTAIDTLPPIAPFTSLTETSTSTTETSSTTDITTVVPTTTTSTLPTTTTPPPTTTESTESSASSIRTVTSFQSQAAASPSASESSTPAPSGFLDNKPVAGIVFGLAGLIGLVIIIFLIALVVRRSRRKQLLEDAVSFDPTHFVAHSSSDNLNRPGSIEKTDYHSGSEHGHSHGHAGYGAGYDTTYGGYPTTYGNNYGPYQGQYAGNLTSEGDRFSSVVPSLQPHLPMSSPLGDSQAYAGYSNEAPVPQKFASTAPKRTSDNGSLTDNAYLGTKDYTVANA